MPNYHLEIINRDNSYNIIIFIDVSVIFSMTIFKKNKADFSKVKEFLEDDMPFNFHDCPRYNTMCFKHNTLIFRNGMVCENQFDGIDSFLYIELNNDQVIQFKQKFKTEFFIMSEDIIIDGIYEI